ncbi:MAG: DNA-directed RNA polymerase subunit P [Nanoarchaeota archaeon]|nr:DNA-directed RNA polymerase subunit P [Nanoarchaeota archaeon]
MMEYTCFNCRKIIEFEKKLRKIRCPWCGGKILMKIKPKIVKKIKAR